MKKVLMVLSVVVIFCCAFSQSAFANEYKLDENGVLWGKGNNEHGQLGREPQFEITKSGNKHYVEVEEFVPILDNVKSYLASVAIYAIREDNSLWAWGQNFSAQCGVGHTEDVYKPVKIMDNVKMVKAMTRGALAVDNNGVLYSWGSNEENMGMASSRGVLGVGDTEELTLSPVKVLEDVRSVYAGSGILTAMAIKNNGELWAAGTHLTIPQNEGWYVFTKVEDLENVKNVELTTFNARIDTEEGDVYFWGDVTDWGGVGSFPLRVVKAFNTPQKVMSGIEKAAGNADMFGLKADGTLWYWGEDTNFADAKCVMNNIKDISTRQYFLSKDGTLYKYDHLYSENEPVIKAMLTDVDCFLDYNIALRKDGTKWELRENDVILIEGGFTYENGVLYFFGEGEASLPKINLQSDEMKTVRIGKDITNVDAVISAFSGHANYMNVEEIIVDEGNEHFSSVDGVLFNKDKSVLIKFPPFKEGEYVIPESVKEIDSRAFARSLRLTSVVISDGVTEIKNGTFSQCMQLESVTIPQSVKKIEEGAFSGGDTNIVGQHPTALKEINYNGTYAQWLKIDKGASYNYHRMNITVGGDILQRATKNFTDAYIIFDGKRIELTAPMYANYDRVMIPLEDICTAMGYSVEWDNTAWGVRAIKGYEQILFPIFPDNVFKGEVYDVYYIDGSGESVVTQNSYQLQSLQGGLYYEDIYHHCVLTNGKAMASVKLIEKVFGNKVVFGIDDITSKAEFVSRYDEYTVALCENTVWAWGGEYGEVPVKLFDNVKELEVLSASLGEYSYYAICEDNSLYVWGAHGYYANMMPGAKPSTYTYVGGMLGLPCNYNVAPRYDGPSGSIDYSKYSEKTPDQKTPFKLLDNVKKVIAGSGKVVTLGVNGDVYIWGEYSGAHRVGDYAPKLINSNAEELYITGTSPAFNTGLIGILEKDGSFAIYDGSSLETRINNAVRVYVTMYSYFPTFFVLTKDGDVWQVYSDKKVVMENVTGFECIGGVIYMKTADGTVYERLNNGSGKISPTDKEIEFEEIFERNITVNVNGRTLVMDAEPYIKNDRTMVPMRAIFEALGAEVSWDNDTRTVVGVMGGVEIKITIGENVLYKNGEAIELDAVAEITNDRTMVPVRAISEAFGCTVSWNNEMKMVEITK